MNQSLLVNLRQELITVVVITQLVKFAKTHIKNSIKNLLLVSVFKYWQTKLEKRSLPIKEALEVKHLPPLKMAQFRFYLV